MNQLTESVASIMFTSVLVLASTVASEYSSRSAGRDPPFGRCREIWGISGVLK